VWTGVVYKTALLMGPPMKFTSKMMEISNGPSTWLNYLDEMAILQINYILLHKLIKYPDMVKNYIALNSSIWV
jgi:hypothetical protein